MKVAFLKSFDAVLGSMALRMTPAPPVPSTLVREIGSILLIRPGGIGDAALLAPAINELRKAYPNARIHILAEKRNGSTFELVPGIERVFLYDTRHGLAEMFRCRYDLVIDTEQWHRLSALVARLTGAPIIIGYATNDRRRMFTHTVPYCQDRYEADSFLDLLIPLGIESHRDENATFLSPPVNALHKVPALLHPLGADPFVAIFPGASIRERQWGGERFRQVVRSLENKGFRSVIVGGGVDWKLGEAITSGTNALNLAGATSLAGTAAIIGSSRLLLSGDSGILHIGVGIGAATVSLFGPGIAAKWAPHGPRHLVLHSGVTCSPCTRFGTTPPCPRNVVCLSAILPEEVTATIIQFLENDERHSKRA